MKEYRKMLRSALCAAAVFAMTTAQTAAAAPAFDAPVTEENAIALLQAYDPEGYYIIKTQIDNGHSDLSFWLMGARTLAGALDTAVHEEFHGYTWNKNNLWRAETIYCGKENGDIIINYEFADGKAYKTENFTKSLPAEMQTFRYDTYVAENASPSANQNGIYGLINEYAAYHWGFHNQLALYPYYKENNSYDDFYNGCINDYQAYEEFRYWTLGLLNYEKKNAPEQYKIHMENKEWIKAYYLITTRFRKWIDMFKQYLAEIDKSGRYGWQTYTERMKTEMERRGINMLEEASAAPELKAIEDLIFAKAAGKPTPTPTPKPTPAPTPTPAPPAGSIIMYRLYNPNSWEHFYTGNEKEKDALVSMGWQDEGVGWYAPITSDTPVYRLYNPNNGGDHHYTMNKKEYDALVEAGWIGEDVRWFSDDNESVPVYREYNPGAAIRNHNYTANKKEHDALVNVYGWKDEGIGWYGTK
ncbi:MAG: hypothetical protein K6A40_03205 [Solobacterium sp.]|nr:hypothetical protein [Solobacterium sp.]